MTKQTKKGMPRCEIPWCRPIYSNHLSKIMVKNKVMNICSFHSNCYATNIEGLVWRLKRTKHYSPARGIIAGR